ncbi:MAG: mannose-1-phosphate guanylyltransferase, partial [Thermoguttaceae bacterium]
MIHCVILAGGSGSRLWPESNSARPKQFMKFDGEQTMLTATVKRLERLVFPENILIATCESYVPLVYESWPGISPNQILVEPVQRNTAPCIGLAAIRLLRNDPDATMIVLPADQVIGDVQTFCDTLRYATNLVKEDPQRLVTIGVTPTFASTSFGYIEKAEVIGNSELERICDSHSQNGVTAYKVKRFHEKPTKETAEKYIDSGNFAWNAGIFIWKARTVLDMFRRYEPELGERLDKIADSVTKNDFPEILNREFSEMKKISIDYAVLEKADNIVTVDGNFGWDDVGTWSSLQRIYASEKDENEN